MVFVTGLSAFGFCEAFVALVGVWGSLGIFGFVVVSGVSNLSGGLRARFLLDSITQFSSSGRDDLVDQ